MQLKKELNNEFLFLKSIIHTSNPNLPQFDNFLFSGQITVDHVCKSKTGKKGGKAHERGPLIKLPGPMVPGLFLSSPIHHELDFI